MTTFKIWLERRKPGPLVPESDKIVRFIQQAGQRGITRADLYGAKLDRHLIDDLVINLSQLGMISVTGSGQGQVIRYSCRI